MCTLADCRSSSTAGLLVALALAAPSSWPGLAPAQGASFRLAFDGANASLNGGAGYKDSSNATGTLAWGESYVMMGYAAMYRGTGDAAYLVSLADHALSVLEQRDNAKGLTDYAGKSKPCWQATKYSSGSQPYCWAVHTGMLTYPMADLVLLVQSDPSLADVPVPGAGTLGPVAELILPEVEASVAVHDGEWKSGSGAGEGHYVGDAAATFTTVAGKALPLNQSNALGRTLVALWAVTGEPAYLKKALGLGHYLRNRMSSKGGALVWTYWGDAFAAGKGEDVSHAAINVDFAALCHEHGIVFTAGDMEALGRTLFETVHIDTGTTSDLVGGGGGTNEYSLQVPRWVNLAPHCPAAWAIGANLLRGVSKTSSGSVLLGLALLARHAPPLSGYTFYVADWQDLGTYRKATAYGANVLLDPPEPKAPNGLRLGYHAKKKTTVQQWDGAAYHDVLRLAPNSGFEQAYVPYDPAIYFPYSGTSALYQFADSFVASEGIEVQEVTVATPPSIVTETLPPFESGAPWSSTLEGTGDPPLLWTLLDGPPGVFLGLESGAISWAEPTGASTVLVRLCNDSGSDSRTFELAPSLQPAEPEPLPEPSVEPVPEPPVEPTPVEPPPEPVPEAVVVEQLPEAQPEPAPEVDVAEPPPEPVPEAVVVEPAPDLVEETGVDVGPATPAADGESPAWDAGPSGRTDAWAAGDETRGPAVPATDGGCSVHVARRGRCGAVALVAGLLLLLSWLRSGGWRLAALEDQRRTLSTRKLLPCSRRRTTGARRRSATRAAASTGSHSARTTPRRTRARRVGLGSQGRSV